MLKPEAQLHVEPFLNAVAEASQALLLLDYDGTLAPFRKERDQAFPYPGVAPVLQEIARNGHTRMVIISGRDTSETIPLLGIEPLPEVWGLHGLQRRTPEGTTEVLPLEEHVLDALSDADRWLGYQQLRHTAEFKTGSIAVHWRGLSDRGVEELRGRVLLGWKPIAEHARLELLEFDGGVEIRAPEADKGDVVRILLDEMSPGTPAAYLGDDATDERAFRAIRGRGLSVLVRPRWRHSAAQLWLKPPDELLDFLTQWREACRRHDAGGSATAVAVSG
ncbi:MAG: trehalose-phosphatase [Terriglobales bacterium]